jgi:hypothetical protein
MRYSSARLQSSRLPRTGTRARADIPADDIRATVETKEIIKGQPGRVVEFLTDNGCCYCSFGFEIAEEYLLFAKQEEDGTYRTSICSRSRKLVEAAADLKRLRDRSRSSNQ